MVAPGRSIFAQVVQDHAGTLTPAERKLVSMVISEPRSAALASLTDLARAAGVHEATASRLARKLGYEGYAAFRQALQAEFIPTRETATRIQRTLDGVAEGGVLSGLVAQEVAGLSDLLTHVGEERIREVAGHLMGARRIHVFARGNAEVLALMMVKRFRRFGRDIQLLSGDARDLAERALAMGAEDVVLVYSFRRQPRHYAPLVEHARRVGARVVAITGVSGHLLTPQPDCLLAAPRSGDPAAFQTLTVPMAISNAIVIAAAQADRGTIERLDALGELIRRFE
jgi:DNA-binding MurR/RpiR family transcriptional regulator